MIADALNRGRGCVDDAGVGGDTEIGCRVESGIAEGCRASGRGGRRREEVRVDQFTKSMIEGTVARMSICIDSRARFDEASRGAPPGGSVESVRCCSSNC